MRSVRLPKRKIKRSEKPAKRWSSTKKTRRKTTETDVDLYNSRLVAACCIEPNFKDAALQEKYGVRGAEDLINLILNPGQYTDLLLAVQEINGFSDDVNDLREEAKN